MPFLALPDAELFYEVTGAGPALVFAHGLGGNHLSWWQQVPFFRERYTCVTFAHRGFAPSRDASGRGPRAFADDLAALIDHLGFTDVRLVAQSMGGWTCTAYTLAHRERVRALVLADTVGTLTHSDIDSHFGRGGGEASLFARGIHPAAGERMAQEQPALHFLYREIDGLSHALDKQSVRAMLAQMRDTPVESFAALGIPLLCIAGDEDIVIPPGAVAALAGLVPGARLARVPEAGHSVYFERPQTFNRLVDTFLDGTG
ncbi:MAG: alpha/beta hydrolase [Chloroflexi bacterium]|nr:alpha/beta hydrolase [Chloroflexota bacterium]